MRKSKFTKSQIAAALKQPDATSSPPPVRRCRAGRAAVRAAVAILLTGVLGLQSAGQLAEGRDAGIKPVRLGASRSRDGGRRGGRECW